MNMRFYILCLMMLFTGHITYSMLAPILAGGAGRLASSGATVLAVAAPRVDLIRYDDSRVTGYCEIFKRTQLLKCPRVVLENERNMLDESNKITSISRSESWKVSWGELVYGKESTSEKIFDSCIELYAEVYPREVLNEKKEQLLKESKLTLQELTAGIKNRNVAQVNTAITKLYKAMNHHFDTFVPEAGFLPLPETALQKMLCKQLPKGSWRIVGDWKDCGIKRGDYGNKVHVCKKSLKSASGQDYQLVAKHVIDEIMIDGKPVNLNKRGFEYELFCDGQKVNLEFEPCQTVDPEEENDTCPYVQEFFSCTAQNNPERAKYRSLDDLIEAGKADDHLVSLAIERDDMNALEKLLKAIAARREPSMSEDYVKKDTARQVHHYYGGRKKNTYNLLAEAMLSAHLGHTNYAPTAQSKLQSILKYDTKEPRFKQAVEYLLEHGNLSMYMQLKGAQAIDNEQMVSDIHKKIASRLFAGVAVGALTGAAKLAYDYMNQQEDQVIKTDAL